MRHSSYFLRLHPQAFKRGWSACLREMSLDNYVAEKFVLHLSVDYGWAACEEFLNSD